MPLRSIRLLGRSRRRKIIAVTKAAKTVLADALELDTLERAELAAELIASLDADADADGDIEATWAAEIERRMAAIDAGTAALSPWSEVKRGIEKAILNK